MRILISQSRTGRFVSFIARPIAAITSKRRAYRTDEALARLDDGLLRDIGIDRCQIHHTLPGMRAVPKPDHERPLNRPRPVKATDLESVEQDTGQE